MADLLLRLATDDKSEAIRGLVNNLNSEWDSVMGVQASVGQCISF
jgi:hypothetical protein